MRTFHPASWSQQARKMCYNQIESIECGYQTINGARKFFSNSYRHPLIRCRAAKSFGRKVREGKVHENMEEYHKHFPERMGEE